MILDRLGRTAVNYLIQSLARLRFKFACGPALLNQQAIHEKTSQQSVDNRQLITATRQEESAMPRKKNELWQNSKAKKLLLQDLCMGTIPLDSKTMPPCEVYRQRPEFAEFDGNYKNFPGRLRTARQQIIHKNNCSASDSAALAHDRQIYPKTANNHRGEPRWEGSETEQLLRLDIDASRHKAMSPQQLYQSRKEYYDNYSLSVFRQHIYQEEKRRKFLAHFGSRNTNQRDT